MQLCSFLSVVLKMIMVNNSFFSCVCIFNNAFETPQTIYSSAYIYVIFNCNIFFFPKKIYIFFSNRKRSSKSFRYHFFFVLKWTFQKQFAIFYGFSIISKHFPVMHRIQHIHRCYLVISFFTAGLYIYIKKNDYWTGSKLLSDCIAQIHVWVMELN